MKPIAIELPVIPFKYRGNRSRLDLNTVLTMSWQRRRQAHDDYAADYRKAIKKGIRASKISLMKEPNRHYKFTFLYFTKRKCTAFDGDGLAYMKKIAIDVATQEIFGGKKKKSKWTSWPDTFRDYVHTEERWAGESDKERHFIKIEDVTEYHLEFMNRCGEWLGNLDSR